MIEKKVNIDVVKSLIELDYISPSDMNPKLIYKNINDKIN